MKTFSLIALCAFAATAAHAQTAGGGYTGPGIALTRVAEAREAADDTHVRLQGTLRQSLGGDHYLFVDASGSINVDIDADLWQGQTVGAGDKIELEGEVDKDWTSVEIDVDRVRKL